MAIVVNPESIGPAPLRPPIQTISSDIVERWWKRPPELLGEFEVTESTAAEVRQAIQPSKTIQVASLHDKSMTVQNSSVKTKLIVTIAIAILITGFLGEVGPLSEMGTAISFVLITGSSITLIVIGLLAHKEKVRALWDYYTLRFLTGCATPVIILGVLATVVGIGGCITALSGWDIPGLDFILKNIPISIAFSLTLVRGGVHAINHGVMTARRYNRERQVAQMRYRIAHIEETVQGLSEESRKAQFANVDRLNNCLPKDIRLEAHLKENELYGKQFEDLPLVREASCQYRLGALKLINPMPLDLFTQERPAIPVPAEAAPLILPNEVDTEALVQDQDPSALSGCNAWYESLYQRLPSLGTFDIGCGFLMLFTACTALVFLAAPSLVPSGLEVFTTDPYLSVPFAFLLFSNCLSCLRTGHGMLSIQKREEKRAQIEEDLLLMDIGLEMTCVFNFNERLKAAVDPKFHQELDKLYTEFLRSLGPYRERLARAQARTEQNEKELGYLHNGLKERIPQLAGPFIVVGVLLVLFGLACTFMSVTHIVPSFLEFLTKNTSLSILFAATLLAVGSSNIYRGGSMSDVEEKKGWKKTSIDIRRDFLERIPELTGSRSARPHPRTIHGDYEVKLDREKPELSPDVAVAVAEKGAEIAKRGCMYGGFLMDPVTHSYFHGFLGFFLLAASIAGIAMALGAPVPDFLDFIAKDPSASAAFFFSLLVVSGDSINTAWRMFTYHDRKNEDNEDLRIIQQCHTRIFAQ